MRQFYCNKVEGLLYIKQNSKLFITNNSLTGNKIFKNACLISRSRVSMNNTNFHSNKMKNFMVAKSQSHIFLNNLTLTNNCGNSIISKNMSLRYLKANMFKNVKRKTIGKSKVSSTVYHLSGNSTIQLVFD